MFRFGRIHEMDHLQENLLKLTQNRCYKLEQKTNAEEINRIVKALTPEDPGGLKTSSVKPSVKTNVFIITLF